MYFLKPLIVLTLIALALYSFGSRGDWRTASRESAGIAPEPAVTSEALLHVYGAVAWGWRGWFAIHSLIAAKRKNENHYTIYDVIGWRGYHGGVVMGINRGLPDRYWYGAKPRLLKSHRGAQAEALIEAVDDAARSYPWKQEYQAFPGPISNTFTAWVARQVPELELELPFSAIGSGYVNQAD